jgi:hypothetical protein
MCANDFGCLLISRGLQDFQRVSIKLFLMGRLPSLLLSLFLTKVKKAQKNQKTP